MGMFDISDEDLRKYKEQLRVEAARKTGMTPLTIESPAESEKVTIVGAGVKDDPMSLEVINVLADTTPAGTF